jgi:ABC-type nickel/cobalt efflux system permease component RcnA
VVASDGPDGALTRGADALTLAFEGLAARTDGRPLAVLAAVLAAVALGAAHAVAPGHGKTVMAFYLSGRRDGGALRSAATVGATVTATHTAAVLLIGVTVSAGTAFAPARLFPWLTLVSGLLVLAVGASLLRTARSDGHGHPHPHDQGHGHAHPHPHPHGHGHPHVGPASAVATLERTEIVAVAAGHSGHADPGREHPHPTAPSRRGLVAMGLAGGLVPSPSALVVFLAAAALGHPWFGVALVVAFGVGMASTLAVVGLLVVRLRDRAEARVRAGGGRILGRVLKIAPLLTAAVVTLLGVSLAVRGLVGTGLL